MSAEADQTRISPFVYHRRVAFSDTDMAGIVHFSAFFRFMEEAEHAFLRQVGLAVIHQQSTRGEICWPRVAANADYVSPARFDDVVVIAVALEKLGRRSVTYHFTLRVHDRLVARGKLTAACCQRAGDAIVAVDIPDEIRATLGTLPAVGAST